MESYKLLNDPIDETAQLTQSEQKSVKNYTHRLFTTKSYTPLENCLRTKCVRQIDCCYDSDLRNALDEGKFITESPLLAYRGDTRPPQEIFDTGFSAYALSRCNFNSLHNCFNSLMCWLACCPVSFICCLCIDASCGQSIYVSSAQGSTKNVLSLTTEPTKAQPYYSAKTQCKAYRYYVYMNGCILFSDFLKQFYPTRNPGEEEIFPRDLNNQSIDSSYIVAAIEMTSTFAGGIVYTSIDTDKCIFNKKFGAWNEIKSVLTKKDVNIEGNFPETKMDHSNLKKLLEEALPELASKSRTTLSP